MLIENDDGRGGSFSLFVFILCDDNFVVVLVDDEGFFFGFILIGLYLNDIL